MRSNRGVSLGEGGSEMAEARAALGVWMDIPADKEDDLNRWYTEEHLKDRLEFPGFLTARRYVSLMGSPKYFAFYDLSGPEALSSPEYMKARANPTPWTRRVTGALTANIRNEYELLQTAGTSPEGGAPYALLVRLETDEAHDAELNQWYEQEHLGALVGVPGVYGAKRYRATEGSPRYLMIYEADNRDVIRGPAWTRAAETEWTLRMRPHFRNRADNVVQLISALRAG
jgi:hypothetical protein